jgi:hypothetical protein
MSSTIQGARAWVGETPAAAANFTVAHVGYTGTDDDRDRWLAASIWLDRTNGFGGPGRNHSDRSFHHDPIDLRGQPPRDFLAERSCYDVVITHNLWGMPAYSPSDASSGAACSPLHSPETWRQRFQASRARYIFMFGSDFNAANLYDPIPGYECLSVPFRSLLNVFVLDTGAASQAQPIDCTDMSKARLAALPALRMNRTLDLSYTDVGGEHLIQLRAMPNLEELRLVGTPLSDADMVHVAQGTELKVLVLDNTQISNAALSRLKRLRHLECLSLNHTAIGDEGISQLRELRGLKWLSLIETGITDRGLSSLQGMSNLEWLCLVNTRVTAAGIEKIKGALPTCSVRCNLE